MLNEIKKKAESIHERVVKFRREIHRHPELSGHEEKTASFVAGVLEANDIDVRTDVGGHGVIGLLKGQGEGGADSPDGSGVPTFAIRADMDALPIHEMTEAAYSSAVPGVMHACGHDVHTSVLMGVAIVLGSLREKLPGNVKFIFQPSEESSIGGSKKMIADGALEDPRPSAIVALHCFPELQAGQVGHKAGVMTASSDRLTINIRGKSGHASRPHQSIDAILVASHVINAIHHIVSRRTDPLHKAVISIGTIKGGTVANIVADLVELDGTVRTVNPELREELPRMIEQTVKGITTAMDAEYDLHYSHGSPSVLNDANVDRLIADCATEALGSENVIKLEEAVLGAEDFAYFAEQVPGGFFRLGTSNREKGITQYLHNSGFNVDERAITVGITLLSWIAAKYLLEHSQKDSK